MNIEYVTGKSERQRAAKFYEISRRGREGRAKCCVCANVLPVYREYAGERVCGECLRKAKERAEGAVRSPDGRMPGVERGSLAPHVFRLAHLRKRMTITGVSVVDLAEVTGTGKRTLYRILEGERTLDADTYELLNEALKKDRAAWHLWRVDGRPMYEMRNRAGLSRSYVAGVLGLDPRTLGHWESGEYRPKRYQMEQVIEAIRKSAGGDAM